MRTASYINIWESFNCRVTENHFVDGNKMVEIVKKGA